MKNKILNIVGIIAVAIMLAVAIFGGGKMNTNLGKFNLNALDNIQTRVTDAVADARARVKELTDIERKTYMNFVRPLMDIDDELNEIIYPVGHLNSVNNSPDTQRAYDSILPIVSEYESDMSRNIDVYNGMCAVKKSEYGTLNPAQRKIVDDAIKSFEIAGVSLPADKQARLKEIDAQHAILTTQFYNNTIASNKKFKLKITDEKLLGEMPATDKDNARVADGWEFTLLATSYTPFMTYVTDSELRHQMYRAFVTAAPENEEIIPQILALSDEKAKILGYKNYAELRFEFRDAKSPRAAMDYLMKIADVVKPVAAREFAELCEFAGMELNPWDVNYYSRILQKEKYNLDENETKPYFELNHTLEKVLGIISTMFDIRFARRNANIWDAGVLYYDVMRDDAVIGGLYLDLQTRESKQNGAWENEFNVHFRDANDNEHMPMTVVVTNFPQQKDGVPSLLTMSHVSTLMHELGHAMHVLLSRVDERSLSGTGVDWDVVEFPSQFMEFFWKSPHVLKQLGQHYKTGEPIPDDLVNRIIRAANFQKGLYIIRQMEMAVFDLELYQSGALDAAGVQKLFDSVRKRIGVIPVPAYNKYQNRFGHIFSGGYAAGYYSYMWAESLAADANIAFGGNPFNRELSYKYRDTVLAMGGTKSMSDIYIDFLGRAPNADSLLKLNGLK